MFKMQQDIDILGITTNYHPTRLRKQIAELFVKLSGSKIPVHAGPSEVLGTHRGYFHAGNEGEGIHLETLDFKIHKTSEAIEFINKTITDNPNEVTIVSIGIPTNIGQCFSKYPKTSKLVKHVVVMGGGSVLLDRSRDKSSIGSYSDSPKEWGDKMNRPPSKSQYPLPKTMEEFDEWLKSYKPTPVHLYPNHNLSGDTLASSILFNKSECKISMIPHYITALHFLKGKSIESLLEVGTAPQKDGWLSGIGGLSGRMLIEWFRKRGAQRGQCPTIR
eukprot:UN29053